MKIRIRNTIITIITARLHHYVDASAYVYDFFYNIFVVSHILFASLIWMHRV